MASSKKQNRYTNKLVVCVILAINLPFFSIRLRAFFNGFHQKAASIDRCIDNVCFLPSDDALYLLTDASITHKVDADSLDSLDEVCYCIVSDPVIAKHPKIQILVLLWYYLLPTI